MVENKAGSNDGKVVVELEVVDEEEETGAEFASKIDSSEVKLDCKVKFGVVAEVGDDGVGSIFAINLEDGEENEGIGIKDDGSEIKVERINEVKVLVVSNKVWWVVVVWAISFNLLKQASTNLALIGSEPKNSPKYSSVKNKTKGNWAKFVVSIDWIKNLKNDSRSNKDSS